MTGLLGWAEFPAAATTVTPLVSWAQAIADRRLGSSAVEPSDMLMIVAPWFTAQ